MCSVQATLVFALFLSACGTAPNPGSPDTSTPDDGGTPDVAVDAPDVTVDTGPSGCEADGPTIASASGCIVGTATATGEEFLGIPYAEPPVGDLRWRPPVTVEPWDAPLLASEVGNICPQSNGTVDGGYERGDGDEDCLYLNVMRPSGARDLPILFWTHGGGWSDGSGSQGHYIASPEIAERAILVTHNYRLGALGFIAHPGLSEESAEGSSGNYGLRDTIAALRWVHENAEALGGDPERILLFGESAGGGQTCSMLFSPSAAGLAQSAIIQSVACYSDLELDDGHAQGERFAAALGCDDTADMLACMRAASVDEVLDALPARLGFLGEGEAYRPIADGHVLPDIPRELVRRGEVNDMTVVAGVNADEAKLFTSTITLGDGWTLGDRITLRLTIRRALEAMDVVDESYILEVLRFYDDPEVADTAKDALDAYITDASFTCPTRAFLSEVGEHVDARGYFFSRVPPWPGDMPLIEGAWHGIEIPYVLGTLDSYGFLPAEEDHALSDAMQRAWVSVASGEPTIDGVGPWPLFEDDVWVRFDSPITVEPDIRSEACDLIDRHTWY